MLFRSLKSLIYYCNLIENQVFPCFQDSDPPESCGLHQQPLQSPSHSAGCCWRWVFSGLTHLLRMHIGFPANFPLFLHICWSNLSPPQVWTTRSWLVWPKLTLAAFLLSMREMLSLSCLPADLPAVRWVIWEQIYFFLVLIRISATIIYQNCFTLPLVRSVCVMIIFLLRTLRSLLKEPAWPAQTSSHSWWPTPSLAALIWPMVVERWVRGFKLTQRSGNKKFPL